jgi:hypothetical protein
VALPEDPELLAELRNIRLRESSPGVYRLDHERGRHDDRAIVLAMAAGYLVERGGTRPARTWSSFKAAHIPRRRAADVLASEAVAQQLRARGVQVFSGGRW